MKTVGLEDLLYALVGRVHPRYGAQEEARWQSHRAHVIADCLGVPIDDDLQDYQRADWAALQALIGGGPRHPLDGVLEAGLIIRHFENELAEVDNVFRDLKDLYQAEQLRLLASIYGDVAQVPETAVTSALDKTLKPNWNAIFDQL